jgi:anaerobic ribonucleoside-triphosphate reductase activating protein
MAALLVKIKLAGLIDESIVDGPGLRYTVFTQGCHHHCLGCHNPKTHDPDKGYYLEIDEIINRIKNNPLISGVTISGGEPFLQIPELYELVSKTKALGLDSIIYTGFTYEELIAKNEPYILNILAIADYLIDGRFEISKKSYVLLFKGSSNQRIIDLKETKLQKKIVQKDFSVY